MKKIFTFLAAALFAATVNAESYTGKLKVNVNGVVADLGKTTVDMTPTDNGKCSFTLKNFTFNDGESEMPVGTINLTGIDLEQKGLVQTFLGQQDLIIADGDDPNVGFWMGSILGEMPIFIQGTVYNGKMNAVILIDANKNSLGVIKVYFGENADEVGQIANSGFEKYHKAGSTDEANAWHSFGSSDGKLASAVKGTAHVATSTDVRPGSEGKTSIDIFSGAVMGKSANGTITTGRLTAGAIDAKSTENHAYLDFTTTDLDGNNDPFYTALVASPDSIGVWVKYKPGKSGIKASVAAVITNGTYYQDPEDKTYENVAAKAVSTNIEANNGEWQYITIPFDYEPYASKNIASNAILVTISTCAEPGGGSTDKNNADHLFVDDLRLIYNYKPLAISYDNNALPNFSPDKLEYTIYGVNKFEINKLDSYVPAEENDESVVIDEENSKAYYTFISSDYQNTITYTINYKSTTGVDGVEANQNKGVAGIYDLSGRRVQMAAGQHGVYIIRTADGKTYKVNK